jgi:hypothetical protein
MRVLALPLTILLAALLLLPSAGAPTPPPPYGTVTGRVVLAGAVPPRRVIHKKGAAVRDAACCARDDLLADDLVIDPKTQGIANVCVFLPKAKAIHPKLRIAPKEVGLALKGCRFEPHVLVVRVGQTVRVTSHDRCCHAFQAGAPGWPGVLVLMQPLKDLQVAVKAPTGKVPIAWVSCPIHRWMKGWWLVLDHPYGALTDTAGRFTLRDLPIGEHTLRVWHEKSGWLHKALKVRVRRGQTTDLGVLRVPLARFDD